MVPFVDSQSAHKEYSFRFCDSPWLSVDGLLGCFDNTLIDVGLVVGGAFDQAAQRYLNFVSIARHAR